MIVVDTNILAQFILRKVHAPALIFADRIFDFDSEWVAPDLWRSEFRNIIAKYWRHGDYKQDQLLPFMQEAEDIIWQSHTPNSELVLQLVIKSKCSAYDCEYVAVAKFLEIPLLTFDQQILREFPKIAVHPEKFLKATN